ncbi:hypothetical protein ACFX13_005845 [Malus domestica]
MEVGEHNVVQVVTDNGSAFVKAGKKLMKHHNVFWTSCATHCIDLMFEAMGKKENISTIAKRARTITNYIYNHGWLLAKMCEFCKGEIIRPATTRFATNYIVLDNLLKKKARLKQLFTTDNWANHNFSRSNAGRMVEKVYPTMGAIYELMRVMKDDLERKHGARPGVGDDGTLIRVVHNVYSKLDLASPAVGQFGNELTWFKDARRTFGELTSVAAQTKMSHTEWWIMYETDAPTEAEIDHVDRGHPLDVFDIVTEDDDTEGNQLYQWIRPLHLDDDEGNPALRVAEEARNEGISVENVLEEKVGSSSANSLEELLRPRPRNTGIPHSSNPTQP